MKRTHGWEHRFATLLATSEASTFQWGQYDCAMFAARVVRELTGGDIAAAYRGKYSTEAGAEAIFLNGFSDLGAFAASIAAANGMTEVKPVTYARRGDVVWVDNLTQYGALGAVHLDGRYAACMSETGIAKVHMSRWRRAWRVG